ncbi:hypothetical protein AgCh_027633 [Apium graveolens]
MLGFLRQCSPTVRFSTVSKNLLRSQSVGLATLSRLRFCKSCVVSKTLLGFKSSSLSLSSSCDLIHLLGLGFNQKLGNPFGQFVGIRHYCVDRNHVVKFKTAPSVEYLGYLTRFFGKFESVPYTKQSLVLFPFFDRVYRVLGDDGFSENVLCDAHPHCIRIRAIARKLLKVLEREDGKHHILAGEEWLGEAMESGNLLGKEWEVLFRIRPEVHAWYTRTGRLLVASALCDYYNTDDEVAFSIAHLMGHVVARHLLRELIFDSIPFWLFYLVKHRKTPSSYYNLRHELEADFIGMFLSASAGGYDPQLAPVVLRNKTGKDGSCPFVAKRIESISHPKLMQEAVAIYQKSIKGQGVSIMTGKRKHDSGCFKRKKKERQDKLTQSLQGSMNRYVKPINISGNSSENVTVNDNLPENLVDENINDLNVDTNLPENFVDGNLNDITADEHLDFGDFIRDFAHSKARRIITS